jgi:hypothetical protein
MSDSDRIALLEKEIVSMSKDNVLTEYVASIYRNCLIEIDIESDGWEGDHCRTVLKTGDLLFAQGHKAIEKAKELSDGMEGVGK